MVGDQFIEIIHEKMATIPMDEVGQVYVEKTKEDTLQGVQPSGNAFPDYAESTAKKKGRSNPVTMRDKDFAIESLRYEELDESSVELYFGEKDEIFNFHQNGDGLNPERRLFPEEKDHNSPSMEESYRKLEVILEEHFNA